MAGKAKLEKQPELAGEASKLLLLSAEPPVGQSSGTGTSRGQGFFTSDLKGVWHILRGGREV